MKTRLCLCSESQERVAVGSCRQPWRSRLALAGLVCALVGLAPFAGGIKVQAQANETTISAVEFQRMVYGAHLLTSFAEAPELDASVEVLLEMQRRNPQADPVALANLLRQALARYRTNAPAHIHKAAYRDEVRAAYLEALSQVPAATNFTAATLELLNRFMISTNDYVSAAPCDLVVSFHSQTARFLDSTDKLDRQQELVEACAARAWQNRAFAQALDGLLVPETGISVTAPPAAIITNTNLALHGNPTFQALLDLSTRSSDGSVTVSSNQVMAWFTNETAALRDITYTNLILQQDFNLTYPELSTYLSDSAAVNAWQQYQGVVQAGQGRRIASATAAVLVQSQLIGAPEETMPKGMKTVVKAVGYLASAAAGLVFGNPSSLMNGAFGLFDIFGGGESAQDALAREVGNVKTMIGDLSTNMNYRFDRVDRSLATIFDTLNYEFSRIEITQDAQGRMLARLLGQVEDVQAALVTAQTDLDRLERHLQYYVSVLGTRDLYSAMNDNLGQEVRHPDFVLGYGDYHDAEQIFYNYASVFSRDPLCSPYVDRDYTPAGLYSELTESQGVQSTNRLDQNLSYIKKYLNDGLRQSTGGSLPLANPRDWFVATQAYLQLATEYPAWFRKDALVDFNQTLSQGRAVAQFLTSLVFQGTNLNTGLHNALLTNYLCSLTNFVSQVRATELFYSTNVEVFPLDQWRNWSVAAPRVLAAGTQPLASDPMVRAVALPRPVTSLAAALAHGLALCADGTVVSWGDSSWARAEIPASATNVTGIAAGWWHSLALRSNGTVLAWGDNRYQQTNVPAGLSGVKAVAAGAQHSLALLTNGTLAWWGDGASGQTNVPGNASNFLAIAAGDFHNLAIQNDRTVVAWGWDFFGQTNVPPEATNVVGVAAGYAHSMALRGDGSVICWGDDWLGQCSPPAEATNLVAIAAAWDHCLGLRADGKVVAWGSNEDGEGDVPADLSQVVAIATSGSCDFALRADGIIVVWGDNTTGLHLIPPQLTWQRAIAFGYNDIGATRDYLALGADGKVLAWGGSAGARLDVPASATNAVALAMGLNNGLALKANGTLLGWGSTSSGVSTVPSGAANNVVAIALGRSHAVALRKDGVVVAWGDNSLGQTNVPALYNTVAIAAARNYSLALRADGTVSGWGTNDYGQLSVPAGLSNVVAISAGDKNCLALRADGRVVAWGANAAGQTNVPATLSNVVAIAADSCMALRRDGTLVGWGPNTNLAPVGATNLVAIAGDAAVRADGAVLCWGSDRAGFDWNRGQTDLSTLRQPLPMDSSTNHFQGVCGGALSVSNSIPFDGYALAFDGVNDSFYTPDLQARFPGSSVTVELWFKPAGQGILLNECNRDSSWSDSQIELVTTATNCAYGEVRLRVWPLAYPGLKLGTVPYGTWNHVALRYNRTNSYLDGFLNGELRAAVQVTRQVPPGGSGLRYGIGQAGPNPLGNGEFFCGQVDELRIWSVARHNLEIQTNVSRSLSGSENGLLGWWRFDEQPLTNPPAVLQVAAGYFHSLALQAGGTVVGFGDNRNSQIQVPPGLSNVIAVAAGGYHSLALRADGTVAAWGHNVNGQSSVPAGLSRVVAIAAGPKFSLALRDDGALIAWGASPQGQTNIPTSLILSSDVVAISAGCGDPVYGAVGGHALALRANGSITAWGDNACGQTDVPGGLHDVVAVAAGGKHSLALRANGQVVGWGGTGPGSQWGQTNVPPETGSNIVAIAAGRLHNHALRSDGTVVTWGGQAVDRFTTPAGLSNVVAISSGGWQSLFLTATPASGSTVLQAQLWSRVSVPQLIAERLKNTSAYVCTQLGVSSQLETRARELNGPKALLQAVLELALPYTLENDAPLRGYLYGADGLADQALTQSLLLADSNSLAISPNARPLVLTSVALARYDCFKQRLSQRLAEIQVSGQPELPRLLGHTLRLGGLFQQVWSNSVPPPALELTRISGQPALLLYGEPYVSYDVLGSSNLLATAWLTNGAAVRQLTPLVMPVSSDPRGFYRARVHFPQ